MSKTTFEVDRANLEVKLWRLYKATPERLFAAYIDAAQIAQWWGPNHLTTTVDVLEVKEGGKWRFIQTDTNGHEHIFSGLYHQIDEPNKIVSTFEYEAMPGHVLEETVTFEPQSDGMTKLTSTAHYTNLEDLEGMVNMDMESGAVESQERLAKLVE
jgi:uncharacterized protein YndB with AHSA1/START domain